MPIREFGIAHSDVTTVYFSLDQDKFRAFIAQEGVPEAPSPEEINDDIEKRKLVMGDERPVVVVVSGSLPWMKKYRFNVIYPDCVLYVGEVSKLVGLMKLSPRQILDYGWEPGDPPVDVNKKLWSNITRGPTYYEANDDRGVIHPREVAEIFKEMADDRELALVTRALDPDLLPWQKEKLQRSMDHLVTKIPLLNEILRADEPTQEQMYRLFGLASKIARSGEGWKMCGDGEWRWGLFGAAGVLFRHTDDDGTREYLLQKRGAAVDEGGTWGIPGGALEEHEDPVAGAFREVNEEMGRVPDAEVVGTHTYSPADDWSYTTIVAEVPKVFRPDTSNWEVDQHRWFTVDEMRGANLHPAFEQNLSEVLKQGAASPTFRFWHGTTNIVAENIRSQGFVTVDPREIAHAVEDHFDLPRDSVWDSDFNMFGHSRINDPWIYLHSQREVAEAYALSGGSEILFDALTAAYFELHDGGYVEGKPASNEWVRKHMREMVGDPVVVALDIPLDAIMERSDIRVDEQEFVEVVEEFGEWGGLRMKPPIPSDWVAGVERVSREASTILWNRLAQRHILTSKERENECGRRQLTTV